MLNSTRIRKLKSGNTKGDYVLYWMQGSQRAEYNFALDFAVSYANDNRLPLIVLFVLYPAFPEANLRHFSFMLQGLRETSKKLTERKIGFACSVGEPVEIVSEVAKNAACVVFDKSYLRMQNNWRFNIIQRVDSLCFEIEDNAVVPARHASHKEEYSAATFRKKVMNLLYNHLEEAGHLECEIDSTDLTLNLSEANLECEEKLLTDLDIDKSVLPSNHYAGGTESAKQLLDDFLEDRLSFYHERRSDPCQPYESGLSPYLHFGQISPIFIASQALNRSGPGTDAFIEELIVRRELSINLSVYNPSYDSLEALPKWSQETLADHLQDRREFVYSLEDLEGSRTHDSYWNAAQTEMVLTGKMHNYMRMYWGKKVIEWSSSPQIAFENLVYLNNKYELDGRDPNSYAGILWCFGKHDRPWKERPIFGKVRYMNAAGLERKFDIECYVKRIDSIKYQNL